MPTCADRYDPFGMKSKEDFTETVKIILNYGADVNARNARGETALHLAARNEFQKVIEVLILAGCDPVVEDNDGNRAFDLTSDGDTVSLQILRHAAAERDRYMSESMEIRARGFTTFTQSQAALPLCVRSSSLLSVPMLMGAAGSPQNLTRAASSPGLFASPPQSAIFHGQLGNGYLANGVIMPQNGSKHLLTQSQGGVGMIPVEAAEPELYSNIPGSQYSVNGAGVPSCRDSLVSQITAPSDVYRLSVNGSAAAPASDVVPVYSSVGPSEKSSIWKVTPPSSVKIQSIIQPDSKSKKVVSEHQKMFKKKSNPPIPPTVARKTVEPNQQLLIQKVPDVIISERMADETDSYFDDESFDTFVESSFTEEEVVAAPPPLPPRSSRSSQGSSVGAESSLQRWLDEQNVLIRSDHGVTSDTKSFCSTVSGSNPPGRPPKLSRPSSVTSTDTVKRRLPPPIPTEIRKEKPKSHKKRSKSGLVPAKKVVEVDSEDWITRQAMKNHHWEDRDTNQQNNDAPKSPTRTKRKVKKKNRVIKNRENGEVYSNVVDSSNRQPVDTSSNLSSTTNDTIVSEQKPSQLPRKTFLLVSEQKPSQLPPQNTLTHLVNDQKPSQLPQNTLPNLSTDRPAHPLVFEKVTMQDNQITNDYLFHKGIAELTAASAENIVECVGRKMSSESSPAAHSSPSVNSAVESVSVGYSPPPVFQYPVMSSFTRQTSPQNFTQQHYIPGNHPQAMLNSSLPVRIEPQRHVMQHSEDVLPYQVQQHSRPVAYSVPLQQQPDPASFHSQVSPDEHSSASLYDTLDDDKLNRCDSGVSDDAMPPYGLNRRTVVLKTDGKLGLTVCGGNVSGTFVRSVAAKSAAATAGLSAGDWIVAVNGKVVKSLSKQEVLQKMENFARDYVRLVVDRDDDRYKLASSKNAVGDSFYVRAHYSYYPVVRGKELAVKIEDIFQVTDSLPEDAVGYWVAKKVGGALREPEPEGLIPNSRKAEQIITKQRLASPTLSRPRGGAFMRSFRRSKYSDVDQDSLDSKQSSECGDIMPYVRIVEQPSSVRRPVVVMGLFCDAVCAMLSNDAPGIFEAPKNAIENRRTSGEEFTPSMLDLTTVRGIVNSGRHCVMVVSPRAVQFLREKTELLPIVIYLSPSSKNVLKAMILQLAPGCDKKPGFMLHEAAKFEKFHSSLFDAVIPYTADFTWLALLKDTVGRLQRHKIWIPFEPEDSYIINDSSQPDLIRTTKPAKDDDHAPNRLSKTTDNIPDQIQDLLFRHINVVSPMVSQPPAANTDDLCTRSFDFGDRQPVLVKPPKPVSAQHADVVLRKPRTRGRPVVSRDCMVSKVHICNMNISKF